MYPTYLRSHWAQCLGQISRPYRNLSHLFFFRFVFLVVFLLVSWTGFAQDVNTQINASTVYDLSIIQVIPDSFPTVDVVFQAMDEDQSPLWGIQSSDLEVLENGTPCQVVELENISEKEIMNVALVIDHSGSMSANIFIADTVTDETVALWLSQPSPLDYAKKGVIQFVTGDALKEDSLLIVGFSTEPDPIFGPSRDIAKIKRKVQAMEPDGGTAFYDALYNTLNALEKTDRKVAIVALTDGMDGNSQHNENDVIKRAQNLEIPIFIIGLGDVNTELLERISRETQGMYYETDEATQLEEIYSNLSRQLKSVYRLRYSSQISGFADSENALTFRFTNDTTTFSNPEVKLELPEEVITYLHNIETARIE